MESAFRLNNTALSDSRNLGIIQALLVVVDFVELWMNKFQENNFLLE
jgi:hypothetical protein